MDSGSLSSCVELVCGGGHTLNVEQKAALNTSLLIVRKDYKFRRVLFWGQIFALENNYFIAQGRGEDELKERKNLYSQNCTNWFLLPAVTAAMIQRVSAAARGRFTGYPSFLYGQSEDSNRGPEPEVTVNEEVRLAVTVHQIDEEASLVPRGAFVRTPTGLVRINRSFAGLTESESKRLDNFLHFREPKKIKTADADPATDFLDVLSEDFYKGAWTLQLESARRVCVLRSLLWLGLTFYHVPMTPQHGHVYIGDGFKNPAFCSMI